LGVVLQFVYGFMKCLVFVKFRAYWVFVFVVVIYHTLGLFFELSRHGKAFG
jgi:hypothetical protein